MFGTGGTRASIQYPSLECFNFQSFGGFCLRYSVEERCWRLKCIHYSKKFVQSCMWELFWSVTSPTTSFFGMSSLFRLVFIFGVVLIFGIVFILGAVFLSGIISFLGYLHFFGGLQSWGRLHFWGSLYFLDLTVAYRSDLSYFPAYMAYNCLLYAIFLVRPSYKNVFMHYSCLPKKYTMIDLM